jgi:hypothetical protein
MRSAQGSRSLIKSYINDLKLRNGPRRVAELNGRVRPNDVQESLERAQEGLGLDLAAGTGRLTHELARRLARVVAVESDEGTRAFVAEGDMLAGSAEDSAAGLQATSFTAAARGSSHVGHDGATLPSLWSDQRNSVRSETALVAQGRSAAFRVTHS